MNKIRGIIKNIATFVQKPAQQQIIRTQFFKAITKNQDKKGHVQIQKLNQWVLNKSQSSITITELQNLQQRVFKQSIRHGLSELVRININKANVQTDINYAGDYESKFLQSHLIHALQLNRIGADNYYFNLDDLLTTQSAYERT
ncbi:unnamed protein product [Paramecium sonneborni]|uniref:Uncharacterized protein n=1 Tax=Paramecium sonneborni TaxID=65129 RepID=A0A8S1QRG7_9CILI|nr:unnamed protein product [Paramecium sonneborni]